MAMEDAGPAAQTREERDAARRRRAQALAEGRTAPPRARDRRGGSAERPPPPWGDFPLTELVVLLALVLGIAGLIIWEERGQIMVVTAMALGSVAGLELSIREHFAGYRSHSTLLAGAAAFAVSTVLLLAAGGGGIALGAVLLVGALVFAGAFYGLRQLFRARSGGLSFR